MEEVYSFRQIRSGLGYLDAEREESYLVKRGQYLSIEFSSAENAIKERIDSETGSLVAKFNDDIDKILEDYCYFRAPPSKQPG